MKDEPKGSFFYFYTQYRKTLPLINHKNRLILLTQRLNLCIENKELNKNGQ
jgi:hypothetical protein